MINLFKSSEGKFNYDYLTESFKKLKPSYPHEFIIIDFNEYAKQNGMFDELNKEIQIYKNGKLVLTRPYIQSILKTLIISNRIPYIDLTLKKMKLKIKKKIKPELIQYYDQE